MRHKKNRTLTKKNASKKMPKVKRAVAKKTATNVLGRVDKIIKRDGSTAKFDSKKITIVIEKALHAAGEMKKDLPLRISKDVTGELEQIKKNNPKFIPAVEEIQDIVEKQLMLNKLVKTAKAYILYRKKHSEMRIEDSLIPDQVKLLVNESKKYFRNQLAEFVYYSMYSRWNPEKGRREAWMETVERYVDFMKENLGNKLRDAEYIQEIECDPRYPNPQTDLCIEKNIARTPTWIREDESGGELKRFEPGVLSLKELSEETGCVLPS